MVSTIILLAFKRWKLASALIVVVLMLNWYWQICPMHFNSDEEPSDNTFRVVTYNIYPQVDSTQYDQWQKDMLEEIKSLHPDILCLQESKMEQMPWLKEELSKLFSFNKDTDKERRYIKGIMYSRFPIANIARYKSVIELDTTDIDSSFDRSIQIHKLKQPFYSADVLLPDGDTITVFSCHLQSNGYSTIRRSMKESDSWISGLERYQAAIKSAEKIRIWEARNIRHAIDSIGNSHPIIIAGDLNDFNQSECLRTIQSNTHNDAWWEGGCGLGFTFSGFGLHLRLDHILYNCKLCLLNVEVGKSELSDHRPLIADIAINKSKVIE